MYLYRSDNNSYYGEGDFAWGTSSTDHLSFGSSNNSATATLYNGWLANLPQLLLSFGYFTINTLCTCMASAEEWNNMARKRKGLRVTDPQGDQRSTYFLQLPYRYSLPLIIISGSAHLLLSQAFFLVRIDSYDRQREIIADRSQSACGFSILSLYVLIGLVFCLLCAVGALSCRRLRMRMPVAASCTLAISAACHRSPSEVDVHLEKVQWGVIEHSLEGEVGHCSFSAQPVRKPEHGVTYR
ncbi:hypothetical protein P280DRAFT_530196 [Massarina eburnea CBS 473.64]|uniref:Uncharacterized protein n=1 Tax=Massarina eburnea CBS 473.64 TaxID=1395130 RepID=A0A6A6RR52_9PLEO|nr:hypothetical protein P280DRAFT_530196 [Massarina eburnea CBS 473.64]